MNCWACGRPARGYGHLDMRYRLADPRRTPPRWVFCSQRCQDAFHQLYVDRHRRDPVLIEELLRMPAPMSTDAQTRCLQALAAVGEHVGFEVPLAHYSRAQALELIEAVVRAHEAPSRPRGPDGFEDRDIPFE